MNFDEAVQRLESVDRILARFEIASPAATAAAVFSLFEQLNEITPVLAGLQVYLKQGGTAGDDLHAILRSIGARCRNLQPILDAGAQYCSLSLIILSIPIQGYKPPGSLLQLEMPGVIAEEG